MNLVSHSLKILTIALTLISTVSAAQSNGLDNNASPFKTKMTLVDSASSKPHTKNHLFLAPDEQQDVKVASINDVNTSEYCFPPLTGKYTVGTKLFYQTDQNRIDRQTGLSRKLVIQTWYPAKTVHTTALYSDEALDQMRPYIEMRFRDNLDQYTAAFKSITTHAIPNATSINYLVQDGHFRKSSFPIIIFEHGVGMNRGSYSYYCEDLASHGYLVVMITHTFIASQIRFADGSQALQDDDLELVDQETIYRDDINYVLNNMHNFLSNTQADFNNIGIIGHSLGGTIATQMCRNDDRFKAGINLDGLLSGPDATKIFEKPFLFMQAAEDQFSKGIRKRGQKTSLDDIKEFCDSSNGFATQIIIDGAAHYTFTDAVILQNIFQQLFDDNNVNLGAGNLPQEQLNEIRKTIVSFFNLHLKNQ